MTRLTLCLLLLSAPLMAQDRSGVSTIQYLENEVSILPADGSSALQAGLSVPLYPGDRLDTGRLSRLEAVLAEGSLLWLDQRSQVELRALARTDGFSDQRSYLFLRDGQMAMEALWEPERGQEPVLGFASGDFYAYTAGFYGLELRGRATYLKLYAGRGELVTDRGSVLLQAGEEAIAYEDGFVDRRRLRREDDAFASWVERRRELRLNAQSTQHTGDALSSYSHQLDQNGSWVYMADISGYAWRPVVAVGWQPYYHGHWRWSRSGWYWVTYEPWGYVTYHYGRWSWFPGYGWMWVPGSVWAPAWVYWYYDPFYIGWCPLGYWDYWWWRGCGWSCWGWNPHHPRDYYHRFNGRVHLTRMDHRGFVFSDAGGFGKGKPAFTLGPEFKGRLDAKGALTAMDLPLKKGDLANPGAALQRASLDLKEDLTPLFKKDFTATAQVKQILTEAGARGLEKGTQPMTGGDRALSPGRTEPRTVELPSGQTPQRQPMRERSVSGPAAAAPSSGGVVSPAPGREAAPAPAPRTGPSTGVSPTPAPRTAPSTPKPSSGPSVSPAPSPAPSDPNKADPPKSSLLVTNLRDGGGAGSVRIEDPDSRLRPRAPGAGSVSFSGEAYWESPRTPSRSAGSGSGRPAVETGSSPQPRTPVYADRQTVSTPSYARSDASSGGTVTRPSASYGTRSSTPSQQPYPYSIPSASSSPSPRSGGTYSAPSRTYSAPSGSSGSHSAPSSSGRVHSAPSSSSSGKSAPSPSSSSGPSKSSSSSLSSSSHSAPKK